MNEISLPVSTRPKILIVDDNPSNLVALKRLLAKIDAEVISADNGNQALLLTLDHDFALILLDVQMPGLDGYEVANLLSGGEHTCGIPIIFVTAAYKDDQHQMMGYASGAVDYLEKPINESVLQAKVRVFLELRKKEELLRVLSMLEKANRNLSIEIERRCQSEEASQQLANTVFAEASEGIMVADANGKVVAINAAFSRMTDFALTDVIGNTCSLLNAGCLDRAPIKTMWSQLQQTGRWQGEVWSRRKHGEAFLSWYSVSTIRNQDRSIANFVFFITDITKRKRDEEALWRQANFDSLTGLPNRSLFIERLSRAIADVKRDGETVALMFIDIDRFKRVNDSMGHGVGDLLLQEIAVRLSECLRGNDTVSRISGDEFSVLLKGLKDATDAVIVANGIVNAISRPFYINGNEVSVGASIGISLFPQDAGDASSLLRNADMAMYSAKEAGRNTFMFFSKKMDKQIQSMVRLSNDLRNAVERNELVLHYQPIIDATSLAIVGAEALVRWKHSLLGMIPPSEFIPVAEDTGLIGSITEWVLSTACRDAAEWQRHSPGPLRVSVNLSNRQRNISGFIAQSADVAAQAGLPRELLTFEITESFALEEIDKIQAIRDCGYGLAIDDFGTGYSSLSYLRKLPADTLKIDRSFVNGLGVHADDTMLVGSIIAIAHGLRMKVVAEGVETQAQVKCLQEAGCGLLQGYYFSKPLPAERFIDYLDGHFQKTNRA